MATFTLDPDNEEGRYMLFVDNAEYALMTAIAKLDVKIRMMDAGPGKDAAIAKYYELDRELTHMKDMDSAWIHGDTQGIRAPTDAEVKQTQAIADKLEKITATTQGYVNLITLAGDLVKVANNIFGAPAA
jgi:hypothetical protein